MSNKEPRSIRHPTLAPPRPPAPVPPVRPGADECCHSGCNPCVFDLYEEEMERYRIALANYRRTEQP
jgi:hypothetical protein